MRIETPVGKITAPKAEKVSYYECPAWFRRLELKAGTYDVYLEVSAEFSPVQLSFAQPGVILAESFDNLFFGTVIAQNRNAEVGKKDAYVHTLPLHLFAADVPPEYRQEPPGKLALDPEWAWVLEPKASHQPHVARCRTIRALVSLEVKILSVQMLPRNHFNVGVQHVGGMSVVSFFTRGDEVFIAEHPRNIELGSHYGDKFWSNLYEWKHI